jgi:hypothetical protein
MTTNHFLAVGLSFVVGLALCANSGCKKRNATGDISPIASFCCGKKLTIVCVMNIDKESAPSMMGRSYQPERSRHETQINSGTVLRFQ